VQNEQYIIKHIQRNWTRQIFSRYYACDVSSKEQHWEMVIGKTGLLAAHWYISLLASTTMAPFNGQACLFYTFAHDARPTIAGPTSSMKHACSMHTGCLISM